MYKVQEVAKIAGVSVRTLHHYDSIGLLKPSNIGANRYRYYNDEDLKLLQQILFLKELSFPLKKIQDIVAHGFDSNYALKQHIELLHQKKERLSQLIENAEQTLLENAGEISLSNEERFAPFTSKKSIENIELYKMEIPELEEVDMTEERAVDEQPELVEVLIHADESSAMESESSAEEATEEILDEEAPAEHQKLEKEEENLEEINREGNRIYRTVASLMHLPAEAPEVQVEMHAYYTLLNRFYDGTPRMFRGLADLYASDQRFARNIDQHGTGLSHYLKEAMYVYAAGLQDA